MIVLFCDTVVKVSELLNLSIYDVNFEFDYIICKGTKKDRMISFSNTTKSVLLKYFESSRDDLLNGKINKYLFVNIKGEQMSRQGFWKIIKEHSKKSGIDASVTFSMIKRS
ncbi:MAG: tyrosine-type recombinase/integrase, partial [Lachnospiraceae bacterium]|nr:tyrosine-type recombinase/integrase [Lachnospiraceae bacterium]